MCGLGFVGLLIFLFYVLLVLTLLSYAGYRLTMRFLKSIRGRKASMLPEN
ncbi:MAG: hypothetical protein PVG64_01685 [Syntrophobacterales bacterium]